MPRKWVKINNVRFRKVEKTLWDIVKSPMFHKIYLSLRLPIPVIMGRLLALFGEPSTHGDYFCSSREYHLEARIGQKRHSVYFILQDLHGDEELIVLLEYSSLPDKKNWYTEASYNLYCDIPCCCKEIVFSLCELIQSSKKLVDFEDYFYIAGEKPEFSYGVKNGMPFYKYAGGFVKELKV